MLICETNEQTQKKNSQHAICFHQLSLCMRARSRKARGKKRHGKRRGKKQNQKNQEMEIAGKQPLQQAQQEQITVERADQKKIKEARETFHHTATKCSARCAPVERLAGASAASASFSARLRPACLPKIVFFFVRDSSFFFSISLHLNSQIECMEAETSV